MGIESAEQVADPAFAFRTIVVDRPLTQLHSAITSMNISVAVFLPWPSNAVPCGSMVGIALHSRRDETGLTRTKSIRCIS